jgi:hypothetical protein
MLECVSGNAYCGRNRQPWPAYAAYVHRLPLSISRSANMGIFFRPCNRTRDRYGRISRMRASTSSKRGRTGGNLGCRQ